MRRCCRVARASNCSRASTGSSSNCWPTSRYEPPRQLLKELLYLTALADSKGPRASELRELFGLAPLPFTDHLLEDESQRLSGPGREVMRSLSVAIREELTAVKDQLDLIERGRVPG